MLFCGTEFPTFQGVNRKATTKSFSLTLTGAPNGSPIVIIGCDRASASISGDVTGLSSWIGSSYGKCRFGTVTKDDPKITFTNNSLNEYQIYSVVWCTYPET